MAEYWWRAYDGSIDHPKLLRLSDAMHRAWYTLQCIASANGGVLPPTADIALRLRMKPSKVAEWIATLVYAELLDNDGGVFVPHNWDARQYKSDVTDPTAPKRMQRYRDRKRNERNATVTVIRPENREQTTEKISEARASGADAPPDPAIPEREYFLRGREVLGSKAGAMIANLLKAKGKNVALARAALEEASQKQSPMEFVAAICRGPPPVRASTVYQQRQVESREILDEINQSIARRGGREDFVALRNDTGDGRALIRGGPSSDVIDIPAKRDRFGG